MKNNYHLYLGKAGHLMVMSEFLIRGWNVAIPEVDIGDDIFVVQDDNGTLRRVQVKTASAKTLRKGYTAQFNVPVNQLRIIGNILIHYVFIVKRDSGWSDPVVIHQDYLYNHWDQDKIGSVYKGFLNLNFTFFKDVNANNKVICTKFDFSNYLCDFTDFPTIV